LTPLKTLDKLSTARKRSKVTSSTWLLFGLVKEKLTNHHDKTSNTIPAMIIRLKLTNWGLETWSGTNRRRL
jgi:hypothetical protein